MSRAVSLYSGGFSSVSFLGDSMCIISALDMNTMALNPIMHTRLSRIHSLREGIAKKTHLEDIFHVASSDNITDICTRRESNHKNMGPGTVWQ